MLEEGLKLVCLFFGFFFYFDCLQRYLLHLWHMGHNITHPSERFQEEEELGLGISRPCLKMSRH